MMMDSSSYNYYGTADGIGWMNGCLELDGGGRWQNIRNQQNFTTDAGDRSNDGKEEGARTVISSPAILARTKCTSGSINECR